MLAELLLSVCLMLSDIATTTNHSSSYSYLSEMYDVTTRILKQCNLKSDKNSLESMILSFDNQQTFNQKCIKINSWPYSFSNLITTHYSLSLDCKYLTLFKNKSLSKIHSRKFQYIVFVHWMMSKLNHSPKSLLDAPESTEIVAIIIKSIKWNHPNYFEDILKPLWHNFVAPILFNKLSDAIKHIHDKNYLKSLCYLNQIIGAYLSVFCTNHKLNKYLTKLVENEIKNFRFVVPQIIFFDIVSTKNLFDIETQKRYFDLWLNDELLMSINHALHSLDSTQPNDTCANSEIVKCFICSLISSADQNYTWEFEHYLHSVLQKDQILIFQAKSRRNKAPILGYYVTVNVIKCMEREIIGRGELLELRYRYTVWYLCKMFARSNLIQYINSSGTKVSAQRHINIRIPRAQIID